MARNNFPALKTEKDLRNLLAGLAKSPPGSGQLMIVGVMYALAAFIAKVQAYLVPFDTAHTAHNNLTTAVQARDAQAKEVRDFVDAAHQYLRTYFGSSNSVLNDYGIKPKKARTQATGAENVVKAAKAKATRQKNGTLGTQQKKALDDGTPPSTPAK